MAGKRKKTRSGTDDEGEDIPTPVLVEIQVEGNRHEVLVGVPVPPVGTKFRIYRAEDHDADPLVVEVTGHVWQIDPGPALCVWCATRVLPAGIPST